MINSNNGNANVIVNSYIKNGADWKWLYSKTDAPEIIRNGAYNIVILQNHSLAPLDDRRRRMVEYAEKFNRIIGTNGGRTYLFCTWARENNPTAQRQITDTYCEVAEAIGAVLIPIGVAWEKILTLTPEISLFTRDGSHPSAEGVYLNACTIYSTITAKSPVGHEQRYVIKHNRPVSIPDKTAELLQRAAWQTAELYRVKCTSE